MKTIILILAILTTTAAIETARGQESPASGILEVMAEATDAVKAWCTERSGVFIGLIPSVPACEVRGIVFALHMGLFKLDIEWWQEKRNIGLGVLWFQTITSPEGCEVAKTAIITGGLTQIPTHLIGPATEICK